MSSALKDISYGNFARGLFITAVGAILLCALGLGCAKKAEEKKPEEQSPAKHEYKEMKPEVYAIPEGVKKALPGLENDNIYIYREAAKTINLVAYVPDYSNAASAEMCAEAFSALAREPELKKDIDFWIIQVQPEPAASEVPMKPQAAEKPKTDYVFVWGVKPAEVDAYLKSKDILEFLRTSEYLLIDDEIIPKGESRLDYFFEAWKKAKTIETQPEIPPVQPEGQAPESPEPPKEP